MVVDNTGTISYIRVLKEDLTIFRITPSEGSIPDFKAGQFVTIGLHIPKEGKIIRRAYSIASPPEQKKFFELIIRWVLSRPQEWFNRTWSGQKGRVESFLRPKAGTGTDRSPLEELVGERITPENTSFYVCGWQGTVDGALDYLIPKGFVTERQKRKDGSYEVKFESYG